MLHGVKINQSIDRSIGLGLAIFPAHTLDTLVELPTRSPESADQGLDHNHKMLMQSAMRL
jgi:hypothetical protein